MSAIWPLGHAYVDCHRMCGRCHHPGCGRSREEHEPNGTPLRDLLIAIDAISRRVKP